MTIAVVQLAYGGTTGDIRVNLRDLDPRSDEAHKEVALAITDVRRGAMKRLGRDPEIKLLSVTLEEQDGTPTTAE